MGKYLNQTMLNRQEILNLEPIERAYFLLETFPNVFSIRAKSYAILDIIEAQYSFFVIDWEFCLIIETGEKPFTTLYRYNVKPDVILEDSEIPNHIRDVFLFNLNIFR